MIENIAHTPTPDFTQLEGILYYRRKYAIMYLRSNDEELKEASKYMIDECNKMIKEYLGL